MRVVSCGVRVVEKVLIQHVSKDFEPVKAKSRVWGGIGTDDVGYLRDHDTFYVGAIKEFST